MAQSNAPGVVIEEITLVARQIQPADISDAGMIAVCERGPVREPVLCENLTQFLETFGGYDFDAAYQARLFFANGGKRLWVSRLAHFTDLTDNASNTGVAADEDFDDIDGSVTLAIDAKNAGLWGNDLQLSIVHNPVVKTTLAVAALTDDTTLYVNSIRGVSEGQVLAIEHGPTPETLAESIALANSLKSLYNSHRADTSAHNSADSTNIVSAANASNLPTLLTLANEIRTDYTAHLANAVAHNSADATNVIASSVPSATDLASAIVLLVALRDAYEGHRIDETAHDAADETYVAHRVEYVKVASTATSLSGSNVINTIVVEAALVNDFATSNVKIMSQEFDVVVSKDDVQIERFNQLSIESDVDNYVVDVINHEDTGSKYIVVTDPSASSAGAGLDKPAEVSLVSLSGGTAVTGSLSALDLIGEESGGTGLYALDDVDCNIVFFAEDSGGLARDAAVIKAAFEYCKAQKNKFFLGAVSSTLTPASAKTLVQNMSIDNSFGALFYNRVLVSNRDTDATSATKYINALGAVAGKMAFVDTNYGPHENAAGEAPYGNLIDVLGVERVLTNNQRSLLNDANINPLYAPKNRGVLIYGARTQDQSIQFRYINVRREMLFLQQSIVDAMQGKVFRSNNLNLAQTIKSVISDFLLSQLNKGALKGSKPSEAFLVKCGEVDGVQTNTDTNNGIFRATVGVAIVRPAEFLTFSFYQIGTESTVGE
jgi:phage tail sheath protein FI